MRAFLAIAIPDDLRARIGGTVADVAASHAGPRWVRAENLHLTVAFLGWIEEPVIGQLDGALAPLARDTSAEELELTGVGAFPSGRPRVLWIGLQRGGPWYVALAERARAALEAGLGLELDRRPPSPHVTVARMERPDRSALEALGAAFAERSFAWRADRLTLYSSVLSRSGPTYSVEREWAFGS